MQLHSYIEVTHFMQQICPILSKFLSIYQRICAYLLFIYTSHILKYILLFWRDKIKLRKYINIITDDMHTIIKNITCKFVHLDFMHMNSLKLTVQAALISVQHSRLASSTVWLMKNQKPWKARQLTPPPRSNSP